MTDDLPSPYPCGYTPRLRSSKLAGQPIVEVLPAPLDESQQKELGDRLRVTISNKETRIRFEKDKVVIDGVLVRDSKPIRDIIRRFRDDLYPRPIKWIGPPRN